MISETKTDFPAAHSMDTEWFGVDDLGNIALFDTGEGGAYPRAIGLAQAYSVAEGHIQIKAELAAKRKLRGIAYDHSLQWHDGIPGPYERVYVPEVPANLSDLSPKVRAYAEKGHLPGTNFLEMQVVQPIEYVQCDVYQAEVGFIINRTKGQLIALPRAHGLTPEMIAGYRELAKAYGLELILPDSPEGGAK